ncbi:hypothetical protein Tco_0442882 [Tanacetum coccineum]
MPIKLGSSSVSHGMDWCPEYRANSLCEKVVHILSDGEISNHSSCGEEADEKKDSKTFCGQRFPRCLSMQDSTLVSLPFAK